MQQILGGNTLTSKQEDRWSINCWKDWGGGSPFTRSLYHPAHVKELLLKSDIPGTAQIHSETGEILSVFQYFLGSHQEAGGTFMINSSKATWFPCKVLCKHQATCRRVNSHLLRPHLCKTTFSIRKSFSLPKQGKKPKENRVLGCTKNEMGEEQSWAGWWKHFHWLWFALGQPHFGKCEIWVANKEPRSPVKHHLSTNNTFWTFGGTGRTHTF